MQEQKPKKRKSIWIIIGGLLLVICTAVVCLLLRASAENPVRDMTFEQCLAYTTHDMPDAKIGVVILQNGESNISFYGNNAQRIPYDSYAFEIGSLSKTFTAAMILRAEKEGTLQLSDSISRFLKLPEQAYYPTIERLLTHQSGYQSFYLEKPMVGNFLSGRNSFYGVTRGMLLRRIGRVQLRDRAYPFEYSNFGYSVLGYLLEELYQTSYTDLVNAFAQQELGMQHTYVSGEEPIPDGWDWAPDDAYLPAGGLISTADDMAIYARALLCGQPEYLLHMKDPLANISATTERLSSLGMRMDSAGASWMLDDAHGIVWHNGGTSHYSSYLGFDPVRQIAVVILTNLSPDYRIPATVLGAKLLLELQQQAG